MPGWITPWALARKGILGMNCRNGQYIQKYNARARYPLVDDKLLTKKIAVEAGLRVPHLFHVVESQYQIPSIHGRLKEHVEFVMKPSRGSGGNGIQVIVGRKEGDYLKINDQTMDRPQMERYLSNILSGLHSLGGRPDKILVESRIHAHPVFDDYSFRGVPDIRVLVFLGFPVMAMLRLSTSGSNGKANLHQGAIGVGLDVAMGRPINAVQRNKVVNRHEDTQMTFEKIKLPDWEGLMQLAARCWEVTGLGYMGVDLVIDRDHGPMILEMNARPGLSIQVANNAGLLPRLRAVEALADRASWTVSERVTFCQEQFGVSNRG